MSHAEWTGETMDNPTWFWQLEQIRKGAPAGRE